MSNRQGGRKPTMGGVDSTRYVWPVAIQPKMRAVRRGVGITLARAYREGA